MGVLVRGKRKGGPGAEDGMGEAVALVKGWSAGTVRRVGAAGRVGEGKAWRGRSRW